MTVVIIFGPTGHVGSAAALSAHSFGASKVVLAMRDPAKAIPGLTSTLEASKPFQRVHADLLGPETVTTAVTTTGAHRAFLYQTFTSQDHLLSVIQAHKAGGIQFVVFLSTATLAPGTDLASVFPAVDPIGYAHAQVELNLISVFGKKGFASVRPAFFATNAIAWWGRMIPTGKVKVFASEVKVDWIAPDDIGRVSSAILLSGGVKDGDEEAVWLVGPQKISLRDGILAIAKRVNGTEAEVEDVDAEEGVKVLVSAGLPQPVASHLVESFGKMKEMVKSGSEEDWLPVGAAWEEAIAVVEKYTGTPAMKLDEWIDKYKGEFKG